MVWGHVREASKKQIVEIKRPGKKSKKEFFSSLYMIQTIILKSCLPSANQLVSAQPLEVCSNPPSLCMLQSSGSGPYPADSNTKPPVQKQTYCYKFGILFQESV